MPHPEEACLGRAWISRRRRRIFRRALLSFKILLGLFGSFFSSPGVARADISRTALSKFTSPKKEDDKLGLVPKARSSLKNPPSCYYKLGSTEVDFTIFSACEGETAEEKKFTSEQDFTAASKSIEASFGIKISDYSVNCESITEIVAQGYYYECKYQRQDLTSTSTKEE